MIEIKFTGFPLGARVFEIEQKGNSWKLLPVVQEIRRVVIDGAGIWYEIGFALRDPRNLFEDKKAAETECLLRNK